MINLWWLLTRRTQNMRLETDLCQHSLMSRKRRKFIRKKKHERNWIKRKEKVAAYPFQMIPVKRKINQQLTVSFAFRVSVAVKFPFRQTYHNEWVNYDIIMCDASSSIEISFVKYTCISVNGWFPLAHFRKHFQLMVLTFG